MKHYFIAALLLVSVSAPAQTLYTYVGGWFEKSVLKDMNKYASDKDNVRNGYDVSTAHENDTLVITITGPEKVVRKLTFKDEDGYCDYDRIEMYSCDSCTSMQVQQMLADKSYKWHKVAENTYWSGYSWNTEMKLEYNVNGICTAMSFRTVNKEKAEYNKIYNAAK